MGDPFTGRSTFLPRLIIVQQINEAIMKGIKAQRITIKFDGLWESPQLHILLTKEDDVIVARCLDFTVSSHGRDDKDALKSLADSLKEYVLSAIEKNSIDSLYDLAHGKYWRMFNELEARQSKMNFGKSLKKSFQSVTADKLNKCIAEIKYA